jgi:hypothetical protein
MNFINTIRNLIRRLFGTAGGIRYQIGGRVYLQRPLVLLQIEQLVEIINPAMFADLGEPTATGIVRVLGSKIAAITAIVLIPQGVEVDERDMADMTAHLRKHLDIAMAGRIVDDFLSCNPISSVFDRLSGFLTTGAPIATAMATGSLQSFASSPAAISPSDGRSSAAAP